MRTGSGEKQSIRGSKIHIAILLDVRFDEIRLTKEIPVDHIKRNKAMLQVINSHSESFLDHSSLPSCSTFNDRNFMRCTRATYCLTYKELA